MATILIYEPNEVLAQKLCDSLKKEKYDAILCDENNPAFVNRLVRVRLGGFTADRQALTVAEIIEQ